jgi:cbb3-type cytochrome oxidase cytochrome c subunit
LIAVATVALVLVLVAGGASSATKQKAREPVHVPPTGYVPQPKSKLSERGRAVYVRLECAVCHTIANAGGRNGPPLDGVGARRSKAFLTEKIADPRAFAEQYPDLLGWEPSQMAHAKVKPQEVEAIVAYLLTLPEPPGGFAVGPHTGEQEDPGWTEPQTYAPLVPNERSQRGRTLFFNSGCVQCHALGRLGGWFGPRLDGIGQRHSRRFIAAHMSRPGLHAVSNPKDFPYGSMMPRIDLEPDEVNAITEYLLTVPDAGDVESAPTEK